MLNLYAIANVGTWLASGNTGLSSLTMAAIALGAEKGDFHVPADSGDFGRCLFLLERVPSLENDFPQIAWFCPAFRPILERWHELADMYHDGKLHEVTRLLRELREVKS